ncbi:MAG: SDR family oxidoreductase [Gammaproteobacteria bacterium]|nr:SDR family oxidoreductase [Gammaproteobacteria bacterium]
MKNPFDLTNKVALVTGASRGIGKSIAMLFAQFGAHVIVSSRKIDGCQQVVDEIEALGFSAEALALHVGSMDDINSAFEAIESKHGKLDILVNNAATNPYFGPIEDTPESAFDKIVQVNLKGYFYMCSNAVKMMSKHGGGSIINVASINGKQPGPWQGVYSITKAGVINMTQAFAKECAKDNVRVNALLPGLTDTKFASALTENKEFLSRIPMYRAAQPEEMAGAVLLFASDAGSYTTGTCMNVDGGFLA